MTVEIEPGMDQDAQEARSIRYVSGLRLALLTSGNWACWFESQDGTRLEVLGSSLDEGWLRSIAEDERRKREEGWAGYAVRRAQLLESAAAPIQQASRNIEDLGL